MARKTSFVGTVRAGQWMVVIEGRVEIAIRCRGEEASDGGGKEVKGSRKTECYR